MRKRGAAREARKDNLLAAQARCRRLTAQLEDREARWQAAKKELARVTGVLDKKEGPPMLAAAEIERHIDRKRIEKLAHSMIEAALDMLRAPR